MVGQIFKHAGTDPTIVLGGAADYLHGNSCHGHGKYVIAEADESDGSFLKFSTFLAVVTNIEDDHLDHYGTVENIKKAFVEFISHITYEDGAAIVCIDNPGVRSILPRVNKKVVTYGFGEEADYRAENKRYDKHIMKFDVTHKGQFLGTISLHVPGTHNVLDALAATVTALYCGISFPVIQEALDAFRGVHRRFETKAFIDGVWIIDDYAHHPTEIRATLTAAKNYPHKTLWCAFQPHTYTRTRAFLKDFASALSLADKVILADIYAAREKDPGDISSADLARELEKLGKEVHYLRSFDEIEKFILKSLVNGDLLITMGAGNIVEIGENLLNN